MYQLLKLIHSYRAFLLFLFIEVVCFWLLVRSNPYHSAAYFRTSSSLIGNIYQTKTNVSQYFNLPVVNEELATDNARLRQVIAQSQVPVIVRSSVDSLKLTKVQHNYGYLAARVINNSTRFTHNFLTINKGRRNGIEPGMGVISSNGVVGKVMSVSDNFATVSSVLNTDVFVSSYIKRKDHFGSINWDGRDALYARLLYIPRHAVIEPGDTIVTSGYNSIYPENILIGYINEFSKGDSWYDIKVALSNDFSTLSYVYVVKNPLKEERIELEQKINKKNE
jgi:rod shape-determining protein MreC